MRLSYILKMCKQMNLSAKTIILKKNKFLKHQIQEPVFWF